MEILDKFKQNGYFTAELYHLLAKKKLSDQCEEITPSTYQKEMKMSTAERLQSLNSIIVDNIVHSGKTPVLSFTPKLIVFQNFKLNDTIVAKFSVKNISKGPTFLNMVYKESSYFFIKPCGGQLLSRLAPGINVTFAITFKPVQYEDCIHKVTFYTDVDRYVLPLIAMGPRPVFDFPDEVIIPKVPLKIENHILFPVHNIGIVPAGFTLTTKCPFSVQPKSGYLKPNDKINIKVAFKTMHLGETHGVMNALFETGENFCIKLLGMSHTVNIQLEKQVVRFLDTYNTLVRQQTFKITNKSDNIISYMCMKYNSLIEDFENKLQLATLLYNVKQSESAKSNKLVYYDVLSSKEHERVYTRVFFDEIQALVLDESLQFQDTHFSITPVAGKLWPNKTTEITITFAPKSIGEFEAAAFLDIDGVKERVPLKLVGTSLPPHIDLNVETLDMDRVYINKTYNYEIVAMNKGHINGVIAYKNVPPLFGSIITCTPDMHCMRPGDRHPFIISFCNSNQGPFFEEINFVIQETSVIIKLYLKGVVIYPSLMFSMPCLDFGMVSLGIPKMLQVDVINESVVHVNANVKILSDGPENSSITLIDYSAADKPKPKIPQWPKEFNIEPYKVDIAPESRVTIKVTLTANLIRAYQTSLELELDKSDSPPIVLPVRFNAMVPVITPVPDINLSNCFLEFSYKQQVHVGFSDFWGYFTLLEPEVESTLEVNVEVKEGLIKPNSTIILPVTIKTSVLGVQDYSIQLYLFGLSKPIEVCHITGCGVRPIVTCNPMAVHWGQVKLLSRTPKILTLINDSPVTVNFKVSLQNRDGRWQILPIEGQIEPDAQTELCASVYLIDAASYTNKAVIQLENIKDILVPLSATGIGTSINVGELKDRVILGRHFTKIPLNCKVVMENCGTRKHCLEWTEHYKTQKTIQQTNGFFSLEPRAFKMAAGERLDLNITGLSYKATSVKEMWYLVGSIEGINKKELLLKCEIVAEFVEPKVVVSSSPIEFQYGYGPYNEFYKLTDIVSIKNVSTLPLDIEISVKPPFALIQKQSSYKILNTEENFCACIWYRESDLNIPSIINENGHQSKELIDYLTLKPVEPLRTGAPHFFQDINKIKHAFNLTHFIEESLEDQDVMKIQILFDCTKHKTLKSKVYCDLLRLKFKGHKNKDSIKLIGKIHFPNILVFTPRVDFQHILNGSIESKIIKIQNTTPLMVCYRFNWKKCVIIDTMPYEDMRGGTTSPVSCYQKGSTTDTTRSGGFEEMNVILSCRTPDKAMLPDNDLDISKALQTIFPYHQDPFAVHSISSAKIISEYPETFKYKMMQRISPMLDTKYDPNFEWSYKFTRLNKMHNLSINDLFQLIPHSGLLKPNEVQYVNIIFRPKLNIHVRAILECEVLGGPPETIIVTGQSSNLLYKINTHKINFKIRSFHENATEDLLISNVAQLPFEYKTYLNEPILNDLHGKIIKLIPPDKVLEPEEQVEIKIEMRPGVIGYFNTTFLLEIGHLPLLPIEVFGFGVIPQVYLCLPRPSISQLDEQLGYLAIPKLTTDYLEVINEIFSNDKTVHLNSPVTERCFEDSTLKKDWHICSSWDAYPSTMDIELAIERLSVVNHINLHPEILTSYFTTGKKEPISGFFTIPYEVDFGVVITGSTKHCSVDVINYGPIVSKLHFAKGTVMPAWLGFKLCGKLGPGERGKIEVSFSPTSNDFKELEQNVKTSVNINVPCGVTIPIIINALCAVPYLVSNIKEINFGSVRCGDKIICSIPLKNIGKPACIWFVSLKLKSLCENPMTVLDSSGKYEAGEGGWLSIAFKPTIEMMFEGLLIFKFHMNPNRMTIPVIGHGILPQVQIIGPNVTFPPTLPWSETSDLYFGLTNPCPFPIELIFAHSDKIWQTEESIYQLLYKYYNKPDEMLVPSIVPGTGLPLEVVNFHTMFKETVKRYSDEEISVKTPSQRSKESSKKSKSPKAAQKQTITKEIIVAKKIRSEAEIVSDVIKELKNANADPLKECLQIFDCTPTETNTVSRSGGILIFVHGSPCEEMQCQEMAYSIGKDLGIPTINIDLCIVEALCVCTCPAKILITSALNEMYDISSKKKYNKTDAEEMNEYEVLSDTNDDDFDVVLKKIQFMARNKNFGTPGSKLSDKKKKKTVPLVETQSRMSAVGSMFQMDLMLELLTEFFKLPKFNRGFVVDTLSSEVFKSPRLSLSTLIKAKHNIWNVHLILCQSDFHKWAVAYEEAQRETVQIDENIPKVYDSTEIENINKMFEEMDCEEFENADPELKNIYVTYGLGNRRRKYFDKVDNVEESVVKIKNTKDNSRSFTTIDKAESKKKMKKEETKMKPTSEYLMMSTRYNDYMKNTYENLINIANNWIFEEGDIGFPLYSFNGQVVTAVQKKTKRKFEIQETQTSEVSLTDRGFPLTIITCPCLRYKEALVHKFATSTLIQNALREEEKDDILKLPVKKKSYTVLLPKVFPVINYEEALQWKNLDEPPIKKCECNQLNDFSLLDDTTQDNVLNILSKWNCTCGKKVTSSQTSTTGVPTVSVEKIVGDESETEVSYPLPLRTVRSMTDQKRRIVLYPGDLVRCKYSFSPQVEGNFTLKRFVEVSGWPESRVDINVSGICDLPRLDSRPKKMFENFVRRVVEDHVYKVTYLDDQKLFQFGPIFIGQNRSNRIYEERYTIDVRNSSLMTTDIVVEFLEDTFVFLLNKSSLMLEPGCRGKIEVSAAPTEVGVHTSVLLFCIKDNPEIVTVTVACIGVVPVVEILPLTKIIEYGKHLLYRRENDRFIVKNDSILPIKWKIRNPDDFIEDFIIAKTSGVILRHDNDVVPVTYIACRVGVISNKALIIDIYDGEERGDPMLTSVLTLSAECYDVMVDCAYEKAGENYLNYGNVKVNSTVYRDMYLMNRGKYNVYYKLKKVKNFPKPSLLRSFEATEECGVILSTQKLATIEFECTPTTSMNLVNVPAYICSILDGSKNQVVVAKFPVCVTIASFYNTFTLFPLGELNFHIIPVGIGVMRDVILNNTSKCPVTYEIVLPIKYRPSPNENPPIHLKDNKLKQLPLQCGNFLIFNKDNLLTPGTSRTIPIQFLATAARTFEETIHFIISDTCPAEAQGVPLKLVGTGAMPTLDFWNLETTFREHLIVKKLCEYKMPKSTPHCVFVEDSVTLHFFCVNVNSSYVAVVDLYNSGLVACALTMKLHFQSNSNQNIFSLDKYQTHIEPLSHKNLGIIFSPKTLEEYRAVLEIKLKLLQNQEQSFKICLIGKGVIPRINLIFPPLRHQKIALLHFPVTCLGSITNKEIRIKNISPVKTIVVAEVQFPIKEERPVFWLTSAEDSDDMVIFGNNDDMNVMMKMNLKPNKIATLYVHYNPIRRGRISCDVKLNVVENPYEYFTVLCEAEAFMEDVILIGLEMLPMDIDLEEFKSPADGTVSTVPTVDSKKKIKSAPIEKRKTRNTDVKKTRKISRSSIKPSDASSNPEHSVLKYTLNFGGCELSVMHRRSVIMVNNSEKVYKFQWAEFDNIVVKPSIGYISPGEEKDIGIIFFSVQPVNIQKELLSLTLTAISDDFLTLDIKATTWDNRQTVTVFDHNKNEDLNERFETSINEQINQNPDSLTDTIQMYIVLSALAEYTKFSCHLASEKNLDDTFIYQIRTFVFQVQNIGKVPMKLMWNFIIDDNYPARIDRVVGKEENKNTNCGSLVSDEHMPDEQITDKNNENEASKITLFSESTGRNSVDTWFEVDLPFVIEPSRVCLKPNESQEFKVTFAPLEAFQFNVRLISIIDNLDPYDQNISCKIRAKSLIPYVHLDIEESDYLTSERRKITGVALPRHISVLEFNVLGSGCYKKAFKIINPTSEGYEFIFEMVMNDKPDLIPMHCNMLKGYVEGGTSTEVVFTFSPTAPGVYESQWKFIIPVHSLVMHLLVVGIVREPDVMFLPTILVIQNSLVGFTTTNTVILRNSENESLNYEFKGNSLFNESGKTPVIVEPEQGVLKPRSDTTINIVYTPIQDGPLSFKIFCNVTYLTKPITLCVNALSYSIEPKVTYYLIGNVHLLNRNAVTNIHLDQTASTYERTIPFTIKNDGSATFFFDWRYNTSGVRKYLNMYVQPAGGHVTPGAEVECILHFTLKTIPVEAFPVTLFIPDGPEYQIYLHAEIEKPLYHFSCKNYDFGRCIVNAPDSTYKKNISFENDDKVPITLALNFTDLPELIVNYNQESSIEPKTRSKISIFFRPKQVKEYEFKLQFWVNSLCEEIVTIKGEGIPLLFDLFEGCQKSFDLGPVKVGEKIVRQIEVMNHSKVPIEASYIFRVMYPNIEDTVMSEGTSVCLIPSVNTIPAAVSAEAGPSRGQMLQEYKEGKIKEQIKMDSQNALSSLKVIPTKCKIKPYMKVPLKIQFKPVGIISDLNVQLNMKVFDFERPLVRLSGSATGMLLCFSQNSLQFGRVRKRGCKKLKVMLFNKGDFGTKFCWEPLVSNEFFISPMQGTIAAHTNVTFTITFRPLKHNPFTKVWACCNIENYMPLELALYATCVDIDNMLSKTMNFKCPVREIDTQYIVVTNPSDDMWLVVSEVSGGPFETLKEFQVEPNSTLDVPIHFKPKTIGKHESQVLFSPLGESALFLTVLGTAIQPNPTGSINIYVAAKEVHTENLLVHNITEFPESYIVSTEINRINPEKFEGYYEIKHPEIIKVWGEAAATCRWTFVCYEECEINAKVMFINEESLEYQFYNMFVHVTASKIVGTLSLVSRARESLRHELVLTNPLSTNAYFAIRCDHLDCPESLLITRNSEATLVLVYSPLVVGEVEDFLEVSNPLVGSYIYKVITKCLPAKEKNLEFKTSLGSYIPLRLRVENKTEVRTDFVATVSHPSIITDKEYGLGPFEKGKLQAWFEPTELGVQNCRVSFKSPVAGEFVFNIKGIALEPQPQGPYKINAGGSVTITFKNIFEDVRTFKICVDREEFVVKNLYEKVKAKKELKITVHFNVKSSRTSLTTTGCLTIETYEPAEPRVQWTYFLEGI